MIINLNNKAERKTGKSRSSTPSLSPHPIFMSINQFSSIDEYRHWEHIKKASLFQYTRSEVRGLRWYGGCASGRMLDGHVPRPSWPTLPGDQILPPVWPQSRRHYNEGQPSPPWYATRHLTLGRPRTVVCPVGACFHRKSRQLKGKRELHFDFCRLWSESPPINASLLMWRFLKSLSLWCCTSSTQDSRTRRHAQGSILCWSFRLWYL